MMAVKALQCHLPVARERISSLEGCGDPEFTDPVCLPENTAPDILHAIRDKYARQPLEGGRVESEDVETGQGSAEAEHAHTVFERVGLQGAAGLVLDRGYGHLVQGGVPYLVVRRQFALGEAGTLVRQALVGTGDAAEHRPLQLHLAVELELCCRLVLLYHAQGNALRKSSGDAYDIVVDAGLEGASAGGVEPDDGVAFLRCRLGFHRGVADRGLETACDHLAVITLQLHIDDAFAHDREADTADKVAEEDVSVRRRYACAVEISVRDIPFHGLLH